MPKGYRHLSQRERGQIMFMSRFGKTSAEIAEFQHRHRSTIWRELRRNAAHDFMPDYYSDESAHLRATHRRHQASQRFRLKNDQIRSYVVEKLKAGWSPEIIAGRIPQDRPGCRISHETIYQYVYHPETEERDLLIRCLRRAHRRRRNRSAGRKSRNTRIPNRIAINQRPAIVTDRKQFGHWEADTLVSSRSRVALRSLVERKSRLLSLERIRRRGARETAAATIKRLGALPASARLTLTLDNGSEHVRHEAITAALHTKCYFCDPYAAWQRASNENINGLIRWYFPKRTDFARLTNAEIARVELAINSRPRKCLGFRTPLEVAAPFVALQR